MDRSQAQIVRALAVGGEQDDGIEWQVSDIDRPITS